MELNNIKNIIIERKKLEKKLGLTHELRDFMDCIEYYKELDEDKAFIWAFKSLNKSDIITWQEQTRRKGAKIAGIGYPSIYKFIYKGDHYRILFWNGWRRSYNKWISRIEIKRGSKLIFGACINPEKIFGDVEVDAFIITDEWYHDLLNKIQNFNKEKGRVFKEKERLENLRELEKEEQTIKKAKKYFLE